MLGGTIWTDGRGTIWIDATGTTSLIYPAWSGFGEGLFQSIFIIGMRQKPTFVLKTTCDA